MVLPWIHFRALAYDVDFPFLHRYPGKLLLKLLCFRGCEWNITIYYLPCVNSSLSTKVLGTCPLCFCHHCK